MGFLNGKKKEKNERKKEKNKKKFEDDYTNIDLDEDEKEEIEDLNVPLKSLNNKSAVEAKARLQKEITRKDRKVEDPYTFDDGEDLGEFGVDTFEPVAVHKEVPKTIDEIEPTALFQEEPEDVDDLLSGFDYEEPELEKLQEQVIEEPEYEPELVSEPEPEPKTPIQDLFKQDIIDEEVERPSYGVEQHYEKVDLPLVTPQHLYKDEIRDYQEVKQNLDEKAMLHTNYIDNFMEHIFSELDNTTTGMLVSHLVATNLFPNEAIENYRGDKYSFSDFNEYKIISRSIDKHRNDMRLAMFTTPYYDTRKQKYVMSNIEQVNTQFANVQVLHFSIQDLQEISATRPVITLVSPIGTPLNNLEVVASWK